MTAPGIRNPTAGVGDGDNQGTPLWLWKLLDREFEFDGDMFANKDNALHENYRTASAPYETSPSEGLVWYANPPYSRHGILGATATVLRAQKAGNTVVMLARLEPGAEWFETIHKFADECRLLDTRLRFRGQAHSYNFPCCVSVFNPAPFGMNPNCRFWFWRVSQFR